jgi:hypothetical protein
MTDALNIWTIYKQPSDYPDSYVARRFEINHIGLTPTSDMFAADTLRELRALLPLGLACIQRDGHDDPKIVESWL